MKRFKCNTCGGDSYSANEQSTLPCPYCGAPKYKPEYQVVNESIAKVIQLFEPPR